jgi:hypothetical protein
MKLYFDDVAFDGQLQRSVGKADSGMANVGECLAIAERITPGDRDSWYRAWSDFGVRLVSRGDAAAKAGHAVSAWGAHLRAAEYFRQAFFFHRDDLGAAMMSRLGPLADQVNDPAADQRFDALLDIPALKALLAPRMATHGLTSVRAYCADLLRYTNADTATRITCPTFVTDNETDVVSPGQGKALFDHLTCPKEFRLFTKAEGAEGHCEGMAPTVFWDAAYNWLDSLLAD